MIADQLKKAVLQAAIQGKLTQQLPEDGDARDLLKEIRAEKARLVKEGRLKKEKPLPEIAEDEIPFEIPENWVWVRLGVIGSIVGGGTPRTENSDYWQNGSIPWLTPADMKFINGKYVGSGSRFISFEGLSNSSAQLLPIGSIVFSSRAPIGYVAITINQLCTNQGFKSIVPYLPGFSDFIYYFLLGNTEEIEKLGSGTTFKEVSGGVVAQILIPLPPLAEQQRIVKKLEEVLPEIEKLALDENKLDELEKAFPKKMKDAILQYAIQGKLTEQLPEDGDARDLLKEIQQEKAKLVKTSKIKKEKPFSPIVEDDIPFDIPDNWEWCRINEIVWLGNGEKKTKKKLPYLEAKVLRGQKESTYRTSGEVVFEGDRIILVDGENSGEVFDVLYEGYLGSTFKKLMFVSDSVIPYTLFFLKKYQTLFKNNKTGSAIPHLNKTLFKELLIPLPPVDEQLRIIDRLEQLLPLCEKLE